MQSEAVHVERPHSADCDLCRLAGNYERQVRYWYHLTFVYGGLAMAVMIVFLVTTWGCSG